MRRQDDLQERPGEAPADQVVQQVSVLGVVHEELRPVAIQRRLEVPPRGPPFAIVEDGFLNWVGGARGGAGGI